jgi:hypothetical protein
MYEVELKSENSQWKVLWVISLHSKVVPLTSDSIFGLDMSPYQTIIVTKPTQ